MKKLMVMSFVLMAVGAFAATPVHVEKSPSGAFSMAAVRTNLNNVIDLALTNAVDIAELPTTAEVIALIGASEADLTAVSNLASSALQNDVSQTIKSEDDGGYGFLSVGTEGASIGWNDGTVARTRFQTEPDYASIYSYAGVVATFGDSGEGDVAQFYKPIVATSITKGGASVLNVTENDARYATAAQGVLAASAVPTNGANSITFENGMWIEGPTGGQYITMGSDFGVIFNVRSNGNVYAAQSAWEEGGGSRVLPQDVLMEKFIQDTRSTKTNEVGIGSATVSVHLDGQTTANLFSANTVAAGTFLKGGDPVLSDWELDAEYFNNDGTETEINLDGFSMSISNGYLVVETTP